MLPVAAILTTNLLLKLGVLLSKGVKASLESVNHVSELLRRDFDVSLRSWLRRSGSSLRRGRRRALRCHIVER